mmetsp:Transcript_4304/g.10957  ORF Transcript_4304/g.10957 Transcript_4304/m.10957 type:complete len:205 (+) Transcript_4304:1295-1909(+)
MHGWRGAIAGGLQLEAHERLWGQGGQPLVVVDEYKGGPALEAGGPRGPPQGGVVSDISPQTHRDGLRDDRAPHSVAHAEMESTHPVEVVAGLPKLAQRREEVVRDGRHRVGRTRRLERGLLQRRLGGVSVVVQQRVRIVPTVVHVVPELVHTVADIAQVHGRHVVRVHVDAVIVRRCHSAANLDVEPRVPCRYIPPHIAGGTDL